MRVALGQLIKEINFAPVDILGIRIPVHEPEMRRLLQFCAA
jgi:hypothetical protein